MWRRYGGTGPLVNNRSQQIRGFIGDSREKGDPVRFFEQWHAATVTSVGLFWTAFWAFGLGYLMSGIIQVFVPRKQLEETLGSSSVKSVGLATFFGFVSSSCSFAALATTRSLFAKGASLASALAFLLASTNLVVELGIVIAMFLSWQFVVAEYLGGILLILVVALLVKFLMPKSIVENARERASADEEKGENNETDDWWQLFTSKKGWRQVADRYAMEWKMVWKDITVGFTVAGAVAVFVPKSFFQALFVGTGSQETSFLEICAQVLVGPAVAFFTFIGSMGNIPLAAVLFGNGVSFAGIIAFIFSDLVVFPVLRIQAKYYGWKMALAIMGLFLVALVSSSILLHYGFAAFDYLPDPSSVKSVAEREFFEVGFGFYMNIGFLLVSGVLVVWKVLASGWDFSTSSEWSERLLLFAALVCFLWLGAGLLLKPLGVVSA